MHSTPPPLAGPGLVVFRDRQPNPDRCLRSRFPSYHKAFTTYNFVGAGPSAEPSRLPKQRHRYSDTFFPTPSSSILSPALCLRCKPAQPSLDSHPGSPTPAFRYTDRRSRYNSLPQHNHPEPRTMADESPKSSPKSEPVGANLKEDADTAAARKELRHTVISEERKAAGDDTGRTTPEGPQDPDTIDHIASPKKKRAREDDANIEPEDLDAQSVASTDSAKDRASRLEPEKKRHRDAAATEAVPASTSKEDVCSIPIIRRSMAPPRTDPHPRTQQNLPRRRLPQKRQPTTQVLPSRSIPHSDLPKTRRASRRRPLQARDSQSWLPQQPRHLEASVAV
jgi:hypothetical protein